jgi:hypothetical protein
VVLGVNGRIAVEHSNANEVTISRTGQPLTNSQCQAAPSIGGTGCAPWLLRMAPLNRPFSLPLTALVLSPRALDRCGPVLRRAVTGLIAE